MDVEQQPEWSALREAAGVALNSGCWSLRLGVFPAFHPPEVLGIGSASRQVVRGRKIRTEMFTEVRWRTWCQAVDYEKLRTPVDRLRHPRTLEPTVRFRSAEIERGVGDQLLQGLGDVQIPALPVGRVCGTDGISFELFAATAMHRCDYKWWCDQPPEWRPLMEWFDRARRTITLLLDEQPDKLSSDAAKTKESPSPRIDA